MTGNCSRSRGHVLVLPYQTQGHINPLLQFAKRIASHGPLVTFAVTRYILRSHRRAEDVGSGSVVVELAPISDGFDDGGFSEAGSVEAYLDRFEKVGSRSLEELILSESAAGRPVDALVFDSFFRWAGPVGRRLGLATAAFFTQSCAVDAVYLHLWEKRLEAPAREAVDLPGLPRLEPRDLPSFFAKSCVYPSYLKLVAEQFQGWEKVDQILINSFHELEPKEAEYLASRCGAKTIGPTIPSKYVDNRLPADSKYGFHLYTPVVEPCMDWLNSKPPESVVFVSFGSLIVHGRDQMAEFAHGLSSSGKSFLWVVRSSEAGKLPEGFADGACNSAGGSGKGLVVPWCSQLDVLAHGAVGCFVSHCGWNSTLEALCAGVPVVGVPQWTDQSTNAKYVEDVWGLGVRAREDGGREGLVRREEVERCVKEVMDQGPRREEMRRNAKGFMELAKKTMADGGSSDRNIAEFVAKYCSKAGCQN